MIHKYEYVPLFYGTPCQVRFWGNGEYFGGIAYHDIIICGCCGDVLKIDDVVEKAKQDGIHFDDAIIELEWLNISDKISWNL